MQGKSTSNPMRSVTLALERSLLKVLTLKAVELSADRWGTWMNVHGAQTDGGRNSTRCPPNYNSSQLFLSAALGTNSLPKSPSKHFPSAIKFATQRQDGAAAYLSWVLFLYLSLCKPTRLPIRGLAQRIKGSKALIEGRVFSMCYYKFADTERAAFHPNNPD